MKKIIFILLISLGVNTQAQNYEAFISHWEGYRNEVYTCSAGHKTIGIGHKLREGENYTFLEDEMIREIFNSDIKEVFWFVPMYVKNFDTQPDTVKLILIDLGFNLGQTRFAKFKNTIKACNDRDYALMAKELKDSKWYHQVGRRSQHHVKALSKIN
jgi:lysozyme